MSAVVSTSYVSSPTFAPLRHSGARRTSIVVGAEKKREGGSEFATPLLAASSAFFSAGQALALTYDLSSFKKPVIVEPTEPATSAVTPPSVDLSSPVTLPSVELPSVDLPSVDLPSVDLGSTFDFSTIQDNPVLLAALAGFAIVGLGVALVSQTGGKAQVKGASAVVVKGILYEDANTIFVDIRSTSSIKESGSPLLKGIKGKSKSVPFTKAGKDEEEGEIVVPDFGERFTKLKEIKDDSVIVLFDLDGKQSPKAAAEILKLLEFKTVLYVVGGESGWKAADLEWKEPSKGISFSFPSLPQFTGVDVSGTTKIVAGTTKIIAETYRNNPQVLGAGVIFGAIAATSLVVISEFDTILEVVGLFGGLNILAREFLFAKKRDKNIDKLKTLVKEDIAPQDAAKDLQRLASAVLSTETPPKSGAVVEKIAEKPSASVKKTESAPVKKTESAPVKKIESSAVKKTESSAVKKTGSSAVKKTGSAPVKKTKSDASEKTDAPTGAATVSE